MHESSSLLIVGLLEDGIYQWSQDYSSLLVPIGWPVGHPFAYGAESSA